jgi:hypothetical protein
MIVAVSGCDKSVIIGVGAFVAMDGLAGGHGLEGVWIDYR